MSAIPRWQNTAYVSTEGQKCNKVLNSIIILILLSEVGKIVNFVSFNKNT